MSQSELDQFVADIDTGGRSPAGAIGKLITIIAFVWAVFQLYIASNLPFWLTEVTGMRRPTSFAAGSIAFCSKGPISMASRAT